MVTLVLTPLNTDRQEYRRIGMMTIKSEEYNMYMAGEDVHEDRETIHIL